MATTAGQRADLVLGVPVFLDGYQDSNTHMFLNRAAFADPCDARAQRRPCGVFGNLGSFMFDNPGSATYDLSLFKTIRLAERAQLQFRSEFYNILNRVNFSGPGSTADQCDLRADHRGRARAGASVRAEATVVTVDRTERMEAYASE